MNSLNKKISIIILTYNEQKNVGNCLRSISDLTGEIFIVDSGSTDNTLNVCKQYTDKIYTNKFENYSNQRNWALDNLPINTDWVLNLDADHRISEVLRNNLLNIFSRPIPDEVSGFLISRRTVFMGRWIKHGGHYPAYHCVLFKKGSGRCEDRKYDQHFVVDGNIQKLEGDIIDIVTESLYTFTQRHNNWSDAEVQQFLSDNSNSEIAPNVFGNPIERKRYLRSVYNNFPLFVRPFMYFIYRYFLRLGFLDGKEGLIFHFLQGFWFRFLIDAKLFEYLKNNPRNKS